MTATYYVGDALEVMGKLPEKSVDLVLTSPPFLALRSYLPADHPDKALEGGSQPTPGAYIDWLIDVVEACDRVLAPHGSLCFELGDTYAGSGGAGGDYEPEGLRGGQPGFIGSARMASGARDAPQEEIAAGVHRIQKEGHRASIRNMNNKIQGGGTGWPLAKSLSLIPELFRFSLVYGQNPLTGRQTERWRLRNVVRWVRPNPPVGALGDKFRPATSELMVFCKSSRRFFDLDATREPLKRPESEGYSRVGGEKYQGTPGDGLSGGDTTGMARYEVNRSNPAGAPPLDWWNIPPGGYSGSHYAVFPPELCIKPIKAMCPEKVCRVCGEPSRRVVEKTEDYAEFRLAAKTMRKDPGMEGAGKGSGGLAGSGYNRDPNGVALGSPTAIHRSGEKYRTVDWTDCGHDSWRPGLVLDCFAGTGTTGAVATGHGRDAILIDLDERNFALAVERIGPMLIDGPYYVDSRDGARLGALPGLEPQGSQVDHQDGRG